MEQIRLFRKRFLPDENIELKDDVILSHNDDVIITKWDVLKPRSDIARGLSAYFIKLGVKVSKIYNAENRLVYWYCDIIETCFDKTNQTYTFTDLMIDVLIYPDGHVEVVDLDEFADISEQDIISKDTCLKTLRITNHLLQKIYSGQFNELTKYIDDAEKAAEF